MSDTAINASEIAASLAALDVNADPKPAQADESQPPTPDGTGRPVNFQIIAPGLFRSSYPQTPHFVELKKLGLKTIITLVPQDLSADYQAFITQNGITHYHIPILANKDPEIYTPDETVYKVLELILEPSKHPMLIHCNKGKHRTGCITACFRRVTGWTLEASIAEYEQYSQPKDRALDKAFITRFNPLPLKALAIERGYVGGVWRQPHFGSTNFSCYTNTSMDTTYPTSDDSTVDIRERIKIHVDTFIEDSQSYRVNEL